MDLDLFACDETGMRCIFVEKFPLSHALMASFQRVWPKTRPGPARENTAD